MHVFRLWAGALLVAAVGLSGLIAPPSASASSVTALSVLERLRVAADSTASYDRAQFGDWIDADRDGCNTRAEVLIAESITPVQVGSGCSITGGSWLSFVDGASWSNPADLDIDHLVPLAEAWRSGATAWTAAQRVAFANDLDFAPSLVAITDNVNQSKGDRDPARWMPPSTAAHCDYVTEWVLVKYRWQLSVDTAEKTALAGHLAGDCGAAVVTLPASALPAVSTPPAQKQPAQPTASAPLAAADAVYRFWSDTYNGHFYTISRSERDFIIQNYPESVWKYEGVAYGAYSRPQTGTVPLYRFWSATYNGHFYTTSASERDMVMRTYPTEVWQYEGVAFHVFPSGSRQANTLPVSRFWSATYLHHFYTSSESEAAYVSATYPRQIWQYEMVGYRVPSERPTAAPLPVPANPGDTRNCGDFATWDEANAWFTKYLPYYGDVARLDADGNRVPCESLPGAPG